MDTGTIAQHIQGLSKHKFDLVCRLILTRMYKYAIVDSDGKGDGAFDFTFLKDSSGSLALAIQRTVQAQRWKEKVIEDAKKAKDNQAQKFFFLTSRIHESATLRELDHQISTQFHIPATCLSGRELADIVVHLDIVFEWAQVIGLNVVVPPQAKPTSVEQMLHAYIALGTDRTHLRDEILDDTLLIAAAELGATADKPALQAHASNLLELPDIRKDQLISRIDSLLTRGLLVSADGNAVRISEAASRQLAVANAIYSQELLDLAAAQNDLLNEVAGVSLLPEDVPTLTNLLSKWFVKDQLERSERMSSAMARMGIAKHFGDPEIEIRQILVRTGVPAQRMSKTISAMVELATDAPLIKKLSRAATYVAVESATTSDAARLLGARDWSEVAIITDASVAIPYLCAELFGPTDGRFSRGVVECLKLLRNLNASLRIPWFYINESASHLLRARTYEAAVSDFSDELEHSENAFVAHFCQLRKANKEIPSTLHQFLLAFSPAVGRPGNDSRDWIRRVMGDLQPLFRDHGIIFEHIDPRSDEAFTKEVEVGYMYKLNELQRKKPFQLIVHDVTVLSHLRRCVSQGKSIFGCLTWDAAMIGLARELGDCGWVVSPVDAADFIQPRMALSEGKLCGLAHKLARTRDTPSVAAARIIDRVVLLAGESLKEWQFRDRIREFKNEALQRINLTDPRYFNQIDDEVATFLKNEGVTASQEKPPEIDE